MSNLYVSMLQRLGIEVDEFSTGRGTMRGLEFLNS
jgi:altronate dehydratase